jgi:phosphatidylglycerol:prolipoprotein diacylglycerol transferase
VITALYIFSRVKNISFLMLSDEIARVVPVGLFFGRIGNYVNKELL